MQKKVFVLGVDPGATGAIALYNVSDGELLFVEDTPYTEIILTTKKKTKRIDVEKLGWWFSEAFRIALENNAELKVHIEKVQAFGKQSAPAAFNFGYAAAIPYALSIAMGFTPLMISPVVWKRRVGLQGADKDAARMMVRQLFPAWQDKFQRKKDVDRSDAVLIAIHKP